MSVRRGVYCGTSTLLSEAMLGFSISDGVTWYASECAVIRTDLTEIPPDANNEEIVTRILHKEGDALINDVISTTCLTFKMQDTGI